MRAFLSHRYGSPAVNLRFFEIFSATVQIQFSVDYGELATNVTRLERLVREADAFIGLYPLGVPALEEVTVEEARKQSRYFRLELDLAIRAGIPAIVFADERYGNVLDCPSWIPQHTFDLQEVEARGDSRQLQVYAHAFEVFTNTVLAYQDYRVRQAILPHRRNTIALMLPSQQYQGPLRERLRHTLQATGREVVDLGWPPQLGTPFYRRLGEIDVAVLDVGEECGSAEIAGFMHGHFVPTIRLARSTPGANSAASRSALFAGYEVGYAKDIIDWHDDEALLVALKARLKTLLLRQRLIENASAARSYFESASLRKEVIFVSYAGADVALAGPVIAALKKTFKTVFDYKDGESILPGRPWLVEIFDTLSRAAAAIVLLSPRYLASGNCLHEAREIVARRDEGKLELLPLRLSAEKIDTPVWLHDTQHAHLSHLGGPDDVSRLVMQLLQPRSG